MTTPYATGAPVYAAAGYHGVIPVRTGQKAPALAGVTGRDGVLTSPAQYASQAATDQYGDCGIGWRLPRGLVGIDVDAYDAKQGVRTMAALTEQLGPLPSTYVSTSRTDGVSGIRLYRVPVDMVFLGEVTVLHADGAFSSDVEIVQHHHRFVMAWPSVHRTGAVYRWISPDGADLPGGLVPPLGSIPHLPESWVTYLAKRVRARSAGAGLAVDDFTARFVNESSPQSLATVLASFTNTPGSRHASMTRALPWAAREAAAGLFPAREAFDRLRGLWSAATAGEGREKEFEEMVSYACSSVSAEDVQRVTERSAGREVKPLEPFDMGDTGAAEPPSEYLPASFWSSRPSLRHIHDAARSVRRAPGPLLVSVMARLSSMLPPQLRIDTGMGEASLNLAGALVGAPGMGKSESASASASLLPAPQYLTERGYRSLALGSGEGIAEAFYGPAEHQDDQATDTRDQGKKVKTGAGRAKVRDNMMFELDEGAALTQMSARNGSTLGSQFRSAVSGQTLGQANATAERNRCVNSGDYSLGFLMNFQASSARELLGEDETALGTPQRFVFMRVTDPTIVRGAALPPRPGPLELDIVHIATSGMPPQPFTSPSGPDPSLVRSMTTPQEIRDWLGELQDAKTAGEYVPPALDAHMPVMLAKLAGLFAVLDGRCDTTLDDWTLARQLWSVSCAVRDQLVGQVRADEKAAREAQDARKVAVAVRTAEALDETGKALVDKATERVARLLWTHGAAAGWSLTVGEHHKKLRSSDRRHRDDAFALAVSYGWLTAVSDDDGRFSGPVTAGPSQPTA